MLPILLYAGCNPFSPSFDEGTGEQFNISDLTTIDGVFQNFKYAYTFKDTSIYGEMVAQDFVFSFINFEDDIPINVSWGREQEMRATYGLFENTQRLDIIWNNIVFENSDSLNANILRGFNLTVTFSNDVIRANGRINLSLRKNTGTGKWQITRWVDESNF